MTILKSGNLFHFEGVIYRQETNRAVEIESKEFDFAKAIIFDRTEFFHMLVRGGTWLQRGRFLWGDQRLWTLEKGTYFEHKFDRCRSFEIIEPPCFAQNNYNLLDDETLYTNGKVIKLVGNTAFLQSAFTPTNIQSYTSLAEVKTHCHPRFVQAITYFERNPYQTYMP